MKKKIILIIIPIIFILLTILFLKFNFYIDIDSNNKKEIEYGEKFNYENPVINLKGKYILKDVFYINEKYLNVENNVNDEIIGTYKIKYNIKYFLWNGLFEENIVIKDTKQPIINLLGDEEITLLPIEKFKEPGFNASDNYDGDISNKVIVDNSNNIITYSVTDSSGNKSEAYRKITIDDPNPPVITLKGEETVTIYINNEYVEPGFSAKDDCDGDITKNVKIENNINNTVEGTYFVKYSVKDTFENLSIEKRTIKVIPLPEETLENVTEEPVIEEDIIPGITIGEPNGKTIYLTFDDGPGKHTEKLLDILKTYKVKATFFVINNNDYNYLMKRIIEDGHTIGLHSNTHNYSEIYVNTESYFKDLNEIQKVVFDNTGVTTNIIRFPGGSSNIVSKKYCEGIMTDLTKMVQEAGFQYFDWNVSSGDASGRNIGENAVFDNVIKGIEEKENSIVLQHDTKEFSVNAVEMIIKWGLENGYKFDVLSYESYYNHHSVNN